MRSSIAALLFVIGFANGVIQGTEYTGTTTEDYTTFPPQDPTDDDEHFIYKYLEDLNKKRNWDDSSA